MVIIRLSRGGSKKRPFYSILVADRRRSARGRFIERVGFYNPIARGAERKLQIDTARVDHWVGHGAQLSERVAQLCRQARREADAPSGESATAKADAAKSDESTSAKSDSTESNENESAKADATASNEAAPMESDAPKSDSTASAKSDAASA
ncbi:MAG: 30S ribosomal protein S16 [bacterium]